MIWCYTKLYHDDIKTFYLWDLSWRFYLDEDDQYYIQLCRARKKKRRNFFLSFHSEGCQQWLNPTFKSQVFLVKPCWLHWKSYTAHWILFWGLLKYTNINEILLRTMTWMEQTHFAWCTHFHSILMNISEGREISSSPIPRGEKYGIYYLTITQDFWVAGARWILSVVAILGFK